MSGVILYEGPSQIDGLPIVCLLLFGSRNRKTGDMDQTYILRSDLHPYDALATGGDKSICGGCPWRPQWRDGETFTGRACYVDLRILGGIWKAYQRGNYRKVDDILSLGRARKIRLGTYGDPAAVPIDVWIRLLRSAEMWTGYTHQWKAAKFSTLKRYCMASCDTEAEVQSATIHGWGTFRVLPVGKTPAYDRLCPASKEGGHVLTCADCGRCDGRRDHVEIVSHGFGAKFVQLRRARPPLWKPNFRQLSFDL